MKQGSKAVAYPGLPLVFAEGFKDYKLRISGHSHASLAVTDIHGMAKTESSADLVGGGVEFRLNGEVPQDQRGAAAYTLVREMLALATDETGVMVSSENHNVLTGSSDSGAAALVTVMDDVLELGLPVARMVELARHVSETAYRSLVGGLSQCIVDERGGMVVSQLKKPSYFSGVNVYAVPFPDIRRFSADDLHRRVVNHKYYPHRANETENRLRSLQRLLDEDDLDGVLSIMESEARTVHRMFAEMGMEVIKPEMKAVTDLVEAMRESRIRAWWNVAGGSAVYVFTLKDSAREVSRELKAKGIRYRHYKIAEAARPIA